jgi:lipoprotein-releasing system ATP-binding protein
MAFQKVLVASHVGHSSQSPVNDPILKAENLAKSYRTGGEQLSVLQDLNFTVQRGERLALIGESGAGKSTLLHLLGGLDKPTAGRIFYENEVISNFDESRRAAYRNRHVGFVWQIHHLLPEFTAIENVMMPLLIRGVAPVQAKPPSLKRLQSVGLAGRADHRAGELSGGERQRVVLARALVAQPSLLLADEPTGNLDQKTGDSVISLIEQLHAEFGLTSVFVTHNLAFAARCDRALKLEAGELVPASRFD